MMPCLLNVIFSVVLDAVISHWLLSQIVNNLIKEANSSDYHHWCVWFILMDMFGTIQGSDCADVQSISIIIMLMRCCFVFVLSAVITRGRLHSYIR